MPAEFYDVYQRAYGSGLDISSMFEVVPWALYSTAILTRGQEAPLQFFSDAMNQEKSEEWTNMYIIGMLPSPQAFVIERIKIFGISSATALYAGSFNWNASEAHTMSKEHQDVLLHKFIRGFIAILKEGHMKRAELRERYIEQLPTIAAMLMEEDPKEAAEEAAALIEECLSLADDIGK